MEVWWARVHRKNRSELSMRPASSSNTPNKGQNQHYTALIVLKRYYPNNFGEIHQKNWKNLEVGEKVLTKDIPLHRNPAGIVLRWIQMDSDLMKWNRWRKKMVRNPAFVFRLGRAPFSCLPFYTRPGFSNKHVADTAGGNSSTWGQNY